MTGIATPVTTWMWTYTGEDGESHNKQIPVATAMHGDGTTLWHLDPPLDGQEHVLICDRTQLLGVPLLEGEPDWASMGITVETRITNPVEVFAADDRGNTIDAEMASIAEPISLLRHTDGIDLDQILTALGYRRNGQTPATSTPESEATDG